MKITNMKNFLIVAVLFSASNSFSQEVKEKIDIKEIRCDSVNFDSTSQLFEYVGDVSFKTDIVEFNNAEKVIHDKKTNEITVYGLSEFCIDGAIQMSKESKMRTLRYKIGEKIAYIE